MINLVRKVVSVLPVDITKERIVRYFPFFTKRVCIQVLPNDLPYFHNHPWNFVSVVLWGGYKEHLLVDGKETVVTHRPGAVLYRTTNQFHYIEPLKDRAVTLFFMGKRRADTTLFLLDGVPHREIDFWLKLGCTKESIYYAYRKASAMLCKPSTSTKD